MSDPKRPGDVPPDLPPEYAEAYRRAYERALGRSGDDEPGVPEPVSTQATSEFQPLFDDEPEPTPKPEPKPEPEPEPTGGAHRADPDPEPVPLPLEEQLADPATDDQPSDRPAWLVPALQAKGCAVLHAAPPPEHASSIITFYRPEADMPAVTTVLDRDGKPIAQLDDQ